MQVVFDWLIIASVEDINVIHVLDLICNVAVARILCRDHAGTRGDVW